MYDKFRKSIELQHYIIRNLFNCNIIDLKEFNDLSTSLDQLKNDLDKEEQKTVGYKMKKFFKRKKK